MKPNNIILNSGLAAYNEDDISVIPSINDAILKATVINTLESYSKPLLENIAVNVDNGVIYLFGSVYRIPQKMAIASIVSKIEGVREVINNITVADKGR